MSVRPSCPSPGTLHHGSMRAVVSYERPGPQVLASHSRGLLTWNKCMSFHVFPMNSKMDLSQHRVPWNLMKFIILFAVWMAIFCHKAGIEGTTSRSGARSCRSWCPVRSHKWSQMGVVSLCLVWGSLRIEEKCQHNGFWGVYVCCNLYRHVQGLFLGILVFTSTG